MGAKFTRQLAAVMFTDIVGYTAMMQEDEQNANRQKERHRRVLQEYAAKFDGSVLHYYGDGALTVFNSAYNAVMCGIAVQKRLSTPYLPLRIGIHTGDIAYNKEDAYGDAINIASRLESLAISGGILISRKVVDEIKNQRELKTKELGTFELKNVQHPISIYAISNEGINVPSPREIKAKSGQIRDRIAVLPFANMSDEKGFDYFSDGLTEEIINGLTKTNSIDVTSRTSAFAYKGRNEDIRTIGDKLMVSHILEGSVRKNKDKIRVTAQLIETGAGFHLWSETFEYHLKDIFEIQDDISKEILGRITKGFSCANDMRKKKFARIQGSQKVYERYLKGTFEFQKRSVLSVRKAITCFNEAIELDPAHTKSRLALARCFLFLGMWGQMSPRRAYKKAEEAVDQVLEKGPSSATVQAVKAIIDVLYYRKYRAANKRFAKAFESESDNHRLSYYYFLFLNIIGQNQTALKWIEQALAQDPSNLLYNAELARAYYNLRRYSDTMEQYNYTLELDQNYLPAIEGKGWTYIGMGELKKAHREFEGYQDLVSREQKNIPHLIYLAARLGMDETASHFLDKLQLGETDDTYIATPIDIALVYLGMEKYDEVFFHLQRAAEDKIGSIYFILDDPVWEEIKQDDRYNNLLNQLKISDALQTRLLVPST